jgi:hypothetical protein
MNVPPQGASPNGDSRWRDTADGGERVNPNIVKSFWPLGRMLRKASMQFVYSAGVSVLDALRATALRI